MRKCICGKEAKLGRKRIGIDLDYFYYYCDCGQSTFSTRKKEFCKELWEATLKHKEQNK